MQSNGFVGFGYAKALIFGEYAVMHGAPGMAMALSPKLFLKLSHIRSLNAQPLISDDFCGRLKLLFRNEFLCDADIEINADDFLDDRNQKYGIGSSAAAIVALLDAYSQIKPSKQIDLHKAIELHRKLQNGMGSGIDIIASLFGGIQLAEHCPESPQITSIPEQNLPQIAILATHRQAPTEQFLRSAQNVSHSAAYIKCIDAISEACQNMAQFAIKGKKRSFLEQMEHMPALLRQLERVMGTMILPPEFDNLFSIAQDCHVTLKTSGAGGGDIFLAMSESYSELSEFLNLLPPEITHLTYRAAPLRYEPGND
ncbi:MAG: hypothetical protein IJM59_08335 [Proteobacteria bacterium]|nr:hypothetical protein [Pseudomonadota bacterium]